MSANLVIFFKSLILTAAVFVFSYFAYCLSIFELFVCSSLMFVVIFVLYRRPLKSQVNLQNKDELAPFLQSLDEGILLLDRSYRMIVCNRSLFRQLGTRAQAIKDLPFFEIKETSRPEVLEKSQTLISEVSLTQPERRETVTFKRGHQSFVMDVTAIMINEREFLLILRDAQKAMTSFNLGKDFIANASHELRTPITIIKGFVETLKEMPEISEAMLEEIFDKILRSCMRMDRIVKNLLILTDLDHLSFANRKEFDMLALLDNCRHTILEVYPKAEIEIYASKKELETKADPDLLELAIMNLLQNAVKYSPAPAKIEIHAEAQAGECILKITDQGYGIPEKNLENIFDRFFSVDKTVSRKLGGAGLGLSIVKTVIDKHQGEISAQNNKAGGTTFTLTIPTS